MGLRRYGRVVMLTGASCLAPAVEAQPLANASAAFIENLGQWPEEVRFRLQDGGATTFVTQDGFRTVLAGGSKVFFTFEGCARDARWHGETPLPGRYHFFKGKDPSRWVTHAASWQRVRCQGLYSGIDLVLEGHGGALEYDLVVHPGGDLGSVLLRIDGASVNQQQDGRVRLEVGQGLVMQTPAIAYEVQPSGIRQRVALSMIEVDNCRWRFTSAYDRSSRLVVDPKLIWSTYFGGLDNSRPMSILRVDDGILVGGWTNSPDFPTTSGSFDPVDEPQTDVFVLELSPDASVVQFGTYIGGSIDDVATRLTRASTGALYVCGGTSSNDFPTTPGAFDETLGGLYDGFVFGLSAAGDQLLFSTYLGGSALEEGPYDVKLVDDGRIAVVGKTKSKDFPTTPSSYSPGSFNPASGIVDAFIVALDATGSLLDYGSYLGGVGGGAEAFGFELRSDGGLAVVGRTSSPNFPTTPGAIDSSYNGAGDAFVTVLDPSWRAIQYSTLLGGYQNDLPLDTDLDAEGNLYLTGEVFSPDFPVTPGAFNTKHKGGICTFVTKLDSSAGMVWSGFLGGTFDWNRGRGVAVDPTGAVYVTGHTGAADFPITPGAYDSTFNQSWDGFLTRIHPSGSQITYSTFLGGTSSDFGWSLAIGPGAEVWVGGETLSTDFPVTPGVFDTTPGWFKGFLAKFDFCGGSVQPVGAGCPGPMGTPPALTGSGCPSPGFSMTMALDGGTPSGLALVVLGFGTQSVPLNASCALSIGPLAPGLVVPIPLSATGSFEIPVQVPVEVPSATLLVQVVVPDPSVQGGIAASNALKVQLAP